MNLTVAQLARAVSTSENYVRQHIKRGHLNVEREGGRVFVSSGEAVRWAQERGLPLSLPPHVSISPKDTEGRVARVAILSWRRDGKSAVNLLTTVRSRWHGALGPWASDPDGTWSSEVVLAGYAGESEEFCLHYVDMTLEDSQKLVDRILAEGKLEVDDIEIGYCLGGPPRRHWAYRDERPDSEQSFRSPFSKHSAEITEYWSFLEGPRDRWTKALESRKDNLEPLMNRLGIRLDRRSDRVGNLVLADAVDTLYGELKASNRDNSLTLSVDRVDGGDLQPDAYTATVWASHSGDDVLRCEIAITQKETVMPLQSDVDRIGFAIYRNSDRLCIDLMDTYLIMGVNIALNMESGSTIKLRDQRRPRMGRFSRSSFKSMIHIDPNEDSTALDNQIRQEFLGRNSFERELATRRDGNFRRFGPDEYKDAVKFFLGLISQHTYTDGPIYLADPYFMSIGPGDVESGLYLDIFQATSGKQLRILSSSKKKIQPAKPWWSVYPDFLAGHVSVRELFRNEYQAAFHDRYLVTDDSEILISNSFNGWRKDGVTFARLPYGIYRAEAEKSWSLGLGMTSDGILIREVN